MNLIVTLDDGNGMMFNHRRQSRDRILNERILGVCKKDLWVSSYTAKLFDGTDAELHVCENFLDQAGDGDWCFAEDASLTPYLEKIETVVIYRWNRVYPSDRVFDLNLSGWNCRSQTDFAGYSHEKITEEVYVR